MNDENHYTAPDGRRYKAEPTLHNNPSCLGCAFFSKLCPNPPGCLSVTRTDRRNIIWKLEQPADAGKGET